MMLLKQTLTEDADVLSFASTFSAWSKKAGPTYIFAFIFETPLKADNFGIHKQQFIANTLQQTLYTVFQKSDAKIQITITTAYLIKMKYPISGFTYHLSDVNVANFNKIHRIVSEQQLF